MKATERDMRLWRVFLLLGLLALCVCCLFGCGRAEDGENTETETETEAAPEESTEAEAKGRITFRTLSVEGTRVYGRVPNDTTVFYFGQEISVEGAARYRIARDASGTEKVPAGGAVLLEEGDNVFYVMEFCGDERTLYTVTVRRQPYYTVRFDMAGGTPISAQNVLEGDTVTLMTEPSRDGYRFLGWDREITLPVTEDLTLTARWEALPVSYTVRHYVEQADGTFLLRETERGEAPCDSEISPAPKEYEHFNAPAKQSKRVDVSGRTTVDYRYTRCKYTLRFVGNGGTAPSSTQRVKWGTALDDLPDSQREGYIFGGWFSDTALTKPLSEMPAEDTTAYAWWTEETKPALLSYVGDTEITLWGCDASVDVLRIPAYIGGKPVTAIADGAFCGHATLRRVVLPETVQRIGEEAFADCPSLLYNERTGGQYLGTEENPYLALVGVKDRQCVDFYVRAETEIIAGGAFAGCTQLENFSLDIGVRWIGANAFYGCTSIQTVWYGGMSEDWKNVVIVSKGNEAFLRFVG